VAARIHFQRREWEETVKFTRAALRRPHGKTPDVYVMGARALAALQRWEEARSAAQLLGKLPDQKASGLAELAAVERAEGGPERAIAVIRKGGLDLTDAANEVALRTLVDASLEAGQVEQALKAVDAALAKRPEQASLYELRGFAYAHADRIDEAKAAYAKALELDAKNAVATAALATLRAKAGDRAGAIQDYDAAAALTEDPAPYLYQAAQLALATGDPQGAERRLREVVRLDPGHVGARNDLAWLLAERGEDLDTAVELARAARRLDPSADVLDTLGWVHLKRGETGESVSALEQAVEKRSDSPSIRYRLGVALERSGDRQRAREMFQTALATGAFPEADAARRELAQLEGQ
jgi:tetratricopeptide (TPR) repeat protein